MGVMLGSGVSVGVPVGVIVAVWEGARVGVGESVGSAVHVGLAGIVETTTVGLVDTDSAVTALVGVPGLAVIPAPVCDGLQDASINNTPSVTNITGFRNCLVLNIIISIDTLWYHTYTVMTSITITDILSSPPAEFAASINLSHAS